MSQTIDKDTTNTRQKSNVRDRQRFGDIVIVAEVLGKSYGAVFHSLIPGREGMPSHNEAMTVLREVIQHREKLVAKLVRKYQKK